MNADIKQNLQAIRKIFEKHQIDWVEPYETTEGAINRKETGDHRGLYYIYPEVNLYFGKAATNTVYNRHKPHRAKLDVDLAGLYSTPVEKKEPKWVFPEGWKEAIRKYIIEDTGEIPRHYTKTGRGTVVPATLEFSVTHKVDVDTLTVLVWDLEHLTAKQISAIEKAVIKSIWPYANVETYKKRKKST